MVWVEAEGVWYVVTLGDTTVNSFLMTRTLAVIGHPNVILMVLACKTSKGARALGGNRLKLGLHSLP